jgi:ATP-dependent DNA helicase RecG
MIDQTSLDITTQRSQDSIPIHGTTPDMLDLNRVAAHIATADEHGRYHGPTDPRTYLHQRHCLVEVDGVIQATPAGILCFGHHPQQIFPRAVVDIGHYRGTEPVSYDVLHLEKDIGGTIFDQLDRVESYLWANTHHGMTITDASSRRIDIHEYPRVVLRELGVNMLAHRDYTNFSSAARIQLLRNRCEWISPGGLPPGVTVENILVAQASRNPAILSILHEAGLVEAFGQGLDTVVAVLQREAMELPQFEDVGSFFMVTVFGRPLEIFYDADSYARLSDRQRRILALARSRQEISLRDITALFDSRTTSRTIQRDIKGLIDAGLLTSIGKGRATRYRSGDSGSW